MSLEPMPAPVRPALGAAVLVFAAPAQRSALDTALLAAMPDARLVHARDPHHYALAVRERAWSLVVVTSGVEGLSLVDAIVQARQAGPVLAIGPAGHTRLVVDAIRSGAADFVADTQLDDVTGAAQRLAAAPPASDAANDGRDAVLLLDRDWVVTGCSPAIGAVLGHDAASLVGWPLETLFPATVEAFALQDRLHACEGPVPVVDAGWMLRRDGLQMWADIACEACDGDAGHRFRVTVRDATLQLRASRFLRGQADSAAAAAGARNLFLGSVAHELRSALAPIATSAVLLERQALEPARHDRLVGIIRRNASSAARLLDDLLTFSTASEDKLALRLRDVDLHALLGDCIDVARQSAATAGIALAVDGTAPPGQAVLRCDPDRIRQVLVNLLGNAIKFTPAGGSIRVRTLACEEGVAVEVVDTGVGIDPAALPFIFDPYEQGGADTTRRFGGFGLGLAICGAIARQHGGKVVASSAGLGQGATFRLCLPAAGARTPADTREPPAALHVLYVEDNADAADAMRYALGTLGWSMSHAGTCAAARAMAARDGHGFDVVLADLGLPDGSGLELGAQLGDRLPFVALTAYGAPLAMQGFASLLIKPAEISEVQRALLKAVAVHRSASTA